MAAAPDLPDAVAAVYASYPEAARALLLSARRLIFDVAAETDGVGELSETLKWGEPAYLTRPGIGSTIRLAWTAKRPQKAGAYFICRTNLVDRFRSMFPDDLAFEGDRAVSFDLNAPLPETPLRACFSEALTYKLRKRR